MSRAEGDITRSRTFRLRYDVVVRVAPGSTPVHIDWRGYEERNISVKPIRFNEMRLSVDGSERYVISDRTTDANELLVNGEPYHFDRWSQQLLVQIGSGVSIEPGGDYESALRRSPSVFDWIRREEEIEAKLEAGSQGP